MQSFWSPGEKTKNGGPTTCHPFAPNCARFFVYPIIAFALSACISATREAVPGFADDLFGRHAVARDDLGPMPRWQKVVTRFAAEKRSAQPCNDEVASTCPAQIWAQLIDQIRALPIHARIERVNEFFNRVPYVSAETNWQDIAYWETPYEFLARGGQCQDYAIVKYLALLESGVPDDLLRFVVVHDNFTSLDHAITIVNVDGIPLALDSQVTTVIPASKFRGRYSPYYALNDAGWAAYISAAQTAVEPRTLTFISTFRVATY